MQEMSPFLSIVTYEGKDEDAREETGSEDRPQSLWASVYLERELVDLSLIVYLSELV